jgi:hypothetical protein
MPTVTYAMRHIESPYAECLGFMVSVVSSCVTLLHLASIS